MTKDEKDAKYVMVEKEILKRTKTGRKKRRTEMRQNGDSEYSERDHQTEESKKKRERKENYEEKQTKANTMMIKTKQR